MFVLCVFLFYNYIFLDLCIQFYDCFFFVFMPVFLLFRRLPSHRTTGPSPHPPPHPHPHPPRVHIRRHRRGGFVFEYGIPYVHGNFCFIMEFVVGITDDDDERGGEMIDTIFNLNRE